jgi:hypothetical protein
VTIATAPPEPPVQVAGNLWYDPVTGTLYISSGTSWMPVTSGGAAATPEVFVGDTTPAGYEVIWVDTTEPETVIRYLVGGSWVTALDGGNY